MGSVNAAGEIGHSGYCEVAVTDLEITRLCAEAMGFNEFPPKQFWTDDDRSYFHVSDRGLPVVYDPLHDDAQAMALVKRFQLYIGGWTGNGTVTVSIEGRMLTSSTDLNRAICECVAKMQAAK